LSQKHKYFKILSSELTTMNSESKQIGQIQREHKSLTISMPSIALPSFNKERNITFMLTAVSITFVCLTVPYTVFELLRKFNVHPIFRNRILHRAVVLLLDCLHASNFILYCLSGKKFRRELKFLFQHLIAIRDVDKRIHSRMIRRRRRKHVKRNRNFFFAFNLKV
jgi:hypothetical protein